MSKALLLLIPPYKWGCVVSERLKTLPVSQRKEAEPVLHPLLSWFQSSCAQWTTMIYSHPTGGRKANGHPKRTFSNSKQIAARRNILDSPSLSPHSPSSPHFTSYPHRAPDLTVLRTQQENCLLSASQEESSQQNPTMLAPWSQTSQPPECMKQMSIVQVHTLWYFVTADRAKTIIFN